MFAATTCDGQEANETTRPFLFNLVGNMQQRPWRQRLRASLLNKSLPVASSSSTSAAAAAAAMQLTEHMIAVGGNPEDLAIVCVVDRRSHPLLPHAHHIPAPSN